MATAKKPVNKLHTLIDRAATTKARIVVKHGRKKAAIVPMEDLEAIQAYERIEEEIDIRELQKARAEIKVKGTIPAEDVYKRLGL